MAEQGFPGFEVRAWFGVIAPAGTPRAIVNRYNAEIRKALAQPEVKDRLTKIGLDPVTSATPEEFTAYIKQEIDKWAKVVKQSGAKAN